LSRAKHLLLGANRTATSHFNRSVDGVFEIVRVVGRRLVAITEVHAILARAHLAQSESKVAHDVFGFLERHGMRSQSGGLGAASLPVQREVVSVLVALTLSPDLFICAKQLLIDANGAPLEPRPITTSLP
jgi:hypothetical protein